MSATMYHSNECHSRASHMQVPLKGLLYCYTARLNEMTHELDKADKIKYKATYHLCIHFISPPHRAPPAVCTDRNVLSNSCHSRASYMAEDLFFLVFFWFVLVWIGLFF